MVSIVVPVYNVEAWIQDTIVSIQNQTYRDWEAIFVIDGSSDGSYRIVKEAAKSDDRIRAIYQDNMGPAIARDNGLKYVTKEYVMFVDADDLLPPDALEVSVNSAIRTDADIVVGDMVLFQGKNPNLVPKPASNEFKKAFNIKDDLISIKYIPVNIFLGTRGLVSCFAKLFKTDFLLKQKICPDVRYGEDRILTTSLFLSTDKIVVIDKSIYYYRQYTTRRAILTYSVFYFDLFKVFSESKQMYIKFNISAGEMAFLHHKYINLFLYIMFNRILVKNWLQYYKRLCALVKKEYKDIELNKLSLFEKFVLHCLRQKWIFFFPFIVAGVLRNSKLYGKLAWLVRPVVKPIIKRFIAR